jgi:A/G-specific adenine glycosylase
MIPVFQTAIESWYLHNKRDLPWRASNNPYDIWLSEIILQQTRVDQGISYYLKFKNSFPSVQDLANAAEQEVLLLWQGLGYYSRARNLHKAARMVVQDYQGKFPEDYQSLLQLPGVGPYTAAAIASIAYGLPHAVVDGNVYRVLARFFGIDTPIDKPAGRRQFEKLANQLIQNRKPAVYNQALMEFGALHCKPVNPLCDRCPLAAHCLALANRTISLLPVKAGKKSTRVRYFDYFVPLLPNRNTIIRQRPAGDIWQGLWEFPLVQGDEQSLHPNPPEFLPVVDWNLFGSQMIHKLTHQQLYTRFFLAHSPVPNAIPEGYQQISISALDRHPFPVLISNFIHHFQHMV